MLTIRETIVRLLAASGAMELTYIVHEVRTQSTERLPVLGADLKKLVRDELAAMERDNLVECDWVEENEDDDGEGFYAWDLVQAGWDLAATYR